MNDSKSGVNGSGGQAKFKTGKPEISPREDLKIQVVIKKN
jgi:hypothetical protein